jgi:hypothetical protein
LPLFSGRGTVAEPTVFICRDGICGKPLTGMAEIASILDLADVEPTKRATTGTVPDER